MGIERRRWSAAAGVGWLLIAGACSDVTLNDGAPPSSGSISVLQQRGHLPVSPRDLAPAESEVPAGDVSSEPAPASESPPASPGEPVTPEPASPGPGIDAGVAPPDVESAPAAPDAGSEPAPEPPVLEPPGPVPGEPPSSGEPAPMPDDPGTPIVDAGVPPIEAPPVDLPAEPPPIVDPPVEPPPAEPPVAEPPIVEPPVVDPPVVDPPPVEPPPPPPSFETDVWPIFRARCAGCHGTARRGGHSVGSPTLSIAFADATRLGATLIERLDGGGMPPACTGSPGDPNCISVSELEMIQRWLDGGMLP